MWFTFLSALVAPAAELLKGLGSGVATWVERRGQLQAARTEAQLAEIKARAELAAYKVKADLEWDLKWADQASTSWKDEFLLILWSIPTICLFIPGARAYVIDGFTVLKTFHPDAPTVFMAGWAVIFAAVFGMKQVLAFMLPGKAARLAEALGGLTPDVPMEAAAAAQKRVS